MEDSAEQTNNKPWLYKKGQSGNPSGRPKGSISMKTWIKNRLETMSDEEREEFMEGLPKEVIWKMAEGNPKQDTDITTNGKDILPDPEIQQKIDDTITKYLNK